MGIVSRGSVLGNSISTTEIEADAVTQSGEASGTSDIATTSNSYADMTDMDVTLTTTGQPILVLFSCPISFGAGNDGGVVALQIDSDTEIPLFAVDSSSVSPRVGSGMYFDDSVESGEHTFKIRWKCRNYVSGTGITNPASTSSDLHHRRMVVIELKR